MCWGDGEYGQLGNGTIVNSPVPVPVTGLSDAVAISAGDFHVCALRTGGSVTCWGDDFFRAGGPSSEPIAVLGITDAIAVSAGGYHNCALLPAGRVACWGRAEEGQVGNDFQSQYVLEPSAVPGITEAVQIATGGYHSCAKLANGTVECWGKGSEGQLGNCSFRNQTTPVRVVREHFGARL